MALSHKMQTAFPINPDAYCHKHNAVSAPVCARFSAWLKNQFGQCQSAKGRKAVCLYPVCSRQQGDYKEIIRCTLF